MHSTGQPKGCHVERTPTTSLSTNRRQPAAATRGRPLQHQRGAVGGPAPSTLASTLQ